MKRWLKRWGIGIAVVLAVLVGAVAVLLHWMNTDNNGTVHVGKPNAENTTAVTPVLPTDVKTPYFTTLLPGGFTIKRQVETPNATPTLLQMVANGGTNKQQFAVTVGALPTDGLSGTGDYNLRVTDKTAYAPFSPPNLPAGAVAYRSTSGAAAFTVFWTHGTHYNELAFSSDGEATYDQLLATYSQVMASWNWR